MTAAARPQTTTTPVESKTTALALYNKKELATFTSPDARALLVPMLPPGVTYETVLSELYFAIQKNPEIAKCEPASMLMAAQRCLTWGLTIGDKAHLVPFKGKLTAVRDYKGDIELIHRATGIHVSAYVVWDDELKDFDYGLGDSPFVKHRPALKRKEGAKIVAAYAVAPMGRGLPPKIVVMGVDEIELIRKTKSKSWVTETYWENGTKKTRPYRIEQIPWYCEKTVVHKIAKQLPTTPQTATALQQVTAQLEEEVIVTDAEIEEIATASPPDGHAANPDRASQTHASDPAAAEQDVSHMEEEPPAPSGPPHLKCGAAMRDDTITKTNVRAPDYQCVAVVGQNAEEAVFCDGKYWPGQWPPKPPATDEQRAELGRLAKVAEKVGLKKVTIDAVNRKVADHELKAHHADQHIKALKEKIEEKEKENAAADRLKSGNGNLDSDPATKGKF